MAHYHFHQIIIAVCFVHVLATTLVDTENATATLITKKLLVTGVPVPSLSNETVKEEILPPSTIPTMQEKVRTTIQVPITADVCNMSLISSSPGEDNKLVKCTCNQFNFDVDCSHMDITELPKVISFPKSVHIVTFAGNRISNLNADTFYNGREVLDLNIAYNHLDFVSVKAFGAFKNLQRLDLSHNRIWNLPVAVFQDLADLKRLDLSYNDLINVFPALFAPLVDLRELNLESNPLQELEPKHFEHLSKLESLNLKSTLLKFIPDHVFAFTPKLKTLNLASNLLEDVPSEALRILDNLRTLDLSGNPIEVVPEGAFLGLRTLVMLYLNRMPELKRIEKYAFGDLEHLEELHCSYNFHLSEIDELAFVNKVSNRKTPLVQLFLRQNALTTLSSYILDWSDEVELHFRDNPLECDCQVEWMIHLRLKNDFQSQVRCKGPTALQGLSLSELKDHQLSCGMELSEIIMVTCAVVAGILIVVLIVSFLLWRRSYAGYSKPHFYNSKKRHVQDIDYRGDESF